MKFDFPRIKKFSKNFRKGIKRFQGMHPKLSARMPQSARFHRGRFHLNHNIIRHVPNMATVLALCSGLTSIRFAYVGQGRLALLAILLAAVFDLMDGRLARILGASSEFGAELDSLSDFVSFGAAPTLIIYFLSLHHLGSLGWSFCLFFSVCSGFRLARFNIMTRTASRKNQTADDYFVGVPAPMGALMALLPYFCALALELTPDHVPLVILVITVVGSGILMISHIPTYTSKNISMPREKLPLILIASGLTLAALFTAPWRVLSIAGIVYAASIGVTGYKYRRSMRR
ncbi:MAG: phosphatidylcholine/phosphatidylserine synthase [Alphaproteobacteria bacterium]|nr:MAG: phosphatidylcholine/phosphatidylserine synthase [Alphaproteobacteria bacterium]